ncbi:hypothetical protein D3C76_94160 [compost metagenome]
MQNMHEVAVLFLDNQLEKADETCHGRLTNRCISHLVDHHDLSLGIAEDITLQALAEIEARSTNFAVDLVRTTPYAVFLVDPRTGNQRCFTIGQLLKIDKDAIVSEPAPEASC